MKSNRMAARTYRVLYDFNAEEDGEMTVSAGALLTVLGEKMLMLRLRFRGINDGLAATDASNADRDGWVLAEANDGSRGFVPADYITAAPSAAVSAPSGMSRSDFLLRHSAF